MPSTREHSQPTAAIHGTMKRTNSSRLARISMSSSPLVQWRRDSTDDPSAWAWPDERAAGHHGMRRAPG